MNTERSGGRARAAVFSGHGHPFDLREFPVPAPGRGEVHFAHGFDRAVLLAVAQGQPPMGRETLESLARSQGIRPTVAKVRAAIERLRRAGLLAKARNGPTAVDDPLFAEYLRDRSLDQLK